MVPIKRLIFLTTLLLLLSLGCNFRQFAFSVAPTVESKPTEVQKSTSNEQAAAITFRIQIPDGNSSDQSIYLNILEEVSGLAFNAQSYKMDRIDNDHYEISLPIRLGSVIKYRYSKRPSSVEVQEHLSDDRPVRYRLYHVINPAIVEDIVSRWTDTQFQSPSGRIQGHITDETTGKPVSSLLVAVGGAQTLSASDGSFLIEGLPAGTHNLVIYAMDGSYQTFQQGATIAPDSTTPVQAYVQPAQLVNVTFKTTAPPDSIPIVPIRLAGNLYQLGNTFADLSGGTNTLARRTPILSVLPDGKYTLTLALPQYADIHYLYTIGDGVWNTEVNDNQVPKIRQVIIGDVPTTIEDTISRWSQENGNSITFDITVPENTPPEDYVSLQLKPVFGWTEPIPMWKLGDNRWGYILYTPKAFLDNLSYRFCRNDQCNYADDERTIGISSTGLLAPFSSTQQSIKDNVENWAWLPKETADFELPTTQISPRSSSFWSGIELTSFYHPTWSPLFSTFLDSIQQTGANWLVVTPGWSYTRPNPPILENVPGENALWPDLIDLLTQSSDRGLQVSIKPVAEFPGYASDWWYLGKKDYSWWQVWFERYRNFALHHADLAATIGAQSLILGGDWVVPALPGGLLADKSISGVPADADARWRLLILEIKNHYNGPLFWSISYSQMVANPPAFLDIVDGIYLEWSEPLLSQGQTFTSQDELNKEASRLFDNGVIPLLARYKKPLVVSVSYPSVEGASTGCIPDGAGGCQNFETVYKPVPELTNASIDLQEQVNLYQAILSVVNQRNWIQGFISAGYYPAATLVDKSISVHGKPAEQLLAYWYSNFYPETESNP